MSERIFEYSELGINKPDVKVATAKFVPLSEYEGQTFSASDAGLSTVTQGRVLHGQPLT